MRSTSNLHFVPESEIQEPDARLIDDAAAVHYLACKPEEMFMAIERDVTSLSQDTDSELQARETLMTLCAIGSSFAHMGALNRRERKKITLLSSRLQAKFSLLRLNPKGNGQTAKNLRGNINTECDRILFSMTEASRFESRSLINTSSLVRGLIYATVVGVIGAVGIQKSLRTSEDSHDEPRYRYVVPDAIPEPSQDEKLEGMTLEERKAFFQQKYREKLKTGTVDFNDFFLDLEEYIEQAPRKEVIAATQFLNPRIKQEKQFTTGLSDAELINEVARLIDSPKDLKDSRNSRALSTDLLLDEEQTGNCEARTRTQIRYHEKIRPSIMARLSVMMFADPHVVLIYTNEQGQKWRSEGGGPMLPLSAEEIENGEEVSLLDYFVRSFVDGSDPNAPHQDWQNPDQHSNTAIHYRSKKKLKSLFPKEATETPGTITTLSYGRTITNFPLGYERFLKADYDATDENPYNVVRKIFTGGKNIATIHPVALGKIHSAIRGTVTRLLQGQHYVEQVNFHQDYGIIVDQNTSIDEHATEPESYYPIDDIKKWDPKRIDITNPLNKAILTLLEGYKGLKQVRIHARYLLDNEMREQFGASLRQATRLSQITLNHQCAFEVTNCPPVLEEATEDLPSWLTQFPGVQTVVVELDNISDNLALLHAYPAHLPGKTIVYTLNDNFLTPYSNEQAIHPDKIKAFDQLLRSKAFSLPNVKLAIDISTLNAPSALDQITFLQGYFRTWPALKEKMKGMISISVQNATSDQAQQIADFCREYMAPCDISVQK